MVIHTWWFREIIGLFSDIFVDCLHKTSSQIFCSTMLIHLGDTGPIFLFICFDISDAHSRQDKIRCLPLWCSSSWLRCLRTSLNVWRTCFQDGLWMRVSSTPLRAWELLGLQKKRVKHERRCNPNWLRGLQSACHGLHTFSIPTHFFCLIDWLHLDCCPQNITFDDRHEGVRGERLDWHQACMDFMRTCSYRSRKRSNGWGGSALHESKGLPIVHMLHLDQE